MTSRDRRDWQEFILGMLLLFIVIPVVGALITWLL